MKFGIACIILNDVKGLKRLLGSIPDLFTVYVIDGRFKDFEGPILSDDGTRELARDYTSVVLTDAPDLMENQKRQVYMDKAANDGVDFLLQVDSDEYIKIDVEKFVKSCEELSKMDKYAFQVEMDYFDLRWQVQTPHRLFYKPSEITYPKYHNEIWAKGRMINSEYGVIVEGVRLVHDKSVRTQEREAINKRWYQRYPFH